MQMMMPKQIRLAMTPAVWQASLLVIATLSGGMVRAADDLYAGSAPALEVMESTVTGGPVNAPVSCTSIATSPPSLVTVRS